MNRQNKLINFFFIFLLILYLILAPKAIPVLLLIFVPILQLISLKKLDLTMVLRIQIIFLLVMIIGPFIVYLYTLLKKDFVNGDYDKVAVVYILLLLLFNIFVYYVKKRFNTNIQI